MSERKLEIPVLPIKGGVVFPDMLFPITVSTERGRKLIDDVLKMENPIILAVAQKDPTKDARTFEDIYKVGTIVKIQRFFRQKEGDREIVRIYVYGYKYGEIVKELQVEPYFKALVEEYTIEEYYDEEIQALVKGIKESLKEYAELVPTIGEEQLRHILNINSPLKLAYTVISNVSSKVDEKQEILEIRNLPEKLKRTLEILRKYIELQKVSEKIKEEVRKEFERSQKEYYLREQLKAIQKELGELDEEIEELAKKIETLPEEVREVARRELNKLRRLQTISPEYHVVRTYLDWLVNLPWKEETQDNLDIKHARKILDEDHYDLQQVKERILEYLAVKKLKKDTKGAILCFVGPPGVGKTSLGRSIARALGRKFVRISLGGVRDEAEIRGHRRTYVGAIPGRIISAIRKVGVKNPVIMLDEIDKLASDFRGDPASALLEVLDPEQNREFVDHYLEVPFDLSKVIFIATANTTITIPPPLLDRMEVINLPGYTLEEKIHIAKKYLIPKEIENNGLENYDVRFYRSAIVKIVENYTREAGVRELSRRIAQVLRKIALKISENKVKSRTFYITSKNIHRYLGPEKYYSEVAERKGEVGVVVGLAWTPVGGEIIFVEALKMHGKGNLKLTGQIGDVMRESAEAAYSLLKANYSRWGIENYKIFEENDVHIHVPEGAIPKDGPSAGITMLMCLISLFTEKPPKPFIAMTGEITLRGKVLPVGGIKEKVLAARRAGIKEVILPKWNRKDIVDIPKENLEGLKLHFVDNVEEAYRIVFEYS